MEHHESVRTLVRVVGLDLVPELVDELVDDDGVRLRVVDVVAARQKGCERTAQTAA